MQKDRIINLIVLIIYMILMIGIGFIFYRKKISSSEFVLGGRKLNPWVTALSAEASDMSGWMLMGLPGLAYSGVLLVNGQTREAIWTAIGLLLGTILNWVLVAKRLRIYTQISGDAQTISSYLNNRFKEKTGILKIVSGVALCIFFTVYAASMFSASAVLFKDLFNIKYKWALLIGVVVITSYVMLGGFLAASWTDFFQGLLMFGAIIAVPLIAVAKMDAGAKAETGLLITRSFKLFSDSSKGPAVLDIIGGIGWGLGYFGMPHILVRFMAIKDPRKTKSSIFIALVWVTIALFFAILVGIVAKPWIKNGTENSERVFIDLSRSLLHPVTTGVIISATIAAVMSTADSQLLVASSAIATDIYGEFKAKKNKKVSEKKMLRLSRVVILILAIIAFIIALDEKSSIFKLVKYAWGGLGAAFGPVMLFSLYSKKLNKYGAVASISTGVIATILFKYWLSRYGGFWAIYELIPGFVLSTLMLYVVSYATTKKVDEETNREIEREYAIVVNTLKKIRKDKFSSLETIVEKSIAYEDMKANEQIHIKEYGIKTNPYLLLCHPKFYELESNAELINRLRDNYYVLIPRVQGFNDSLSDYTNAKDIALKIKNKLGGIGCANISHAYSFGFTNSILAELLVANTNITETILMAPKRKTNIHSTKGLQENHLSARPSRTTIRRVEHSKDTYDLKDKNVTCFILNDLVEKERINNKFKNAKVVNCIDLNDQTELTKMLYFFFGFKEYK